MSDGNLVRVIRGVEPCLRSQYQASATTSLLTIGRREQPSPHEGLAGGPAQLREFHQTRRNKNRHRVTFAKEIKSSVSRADILRCWHAKSSPAENGGIIGA